MRGYKGPIAWKENLPRKRVSWLITLYIVWHTCYSPSYSIILCDDTRLIEPTYAWFQKIRLYLMMIVFKQTASQTCLAVHTIFCTFLRIIFLRRICSNNLRTYSTNLSCMSVTVLVSLGVVLSQKNDMPLFMCTRRRCMLTRLIDRMLCP